MHETGVYITTPEVCRVPPCRLLRLRPPLPSDCAPCLQVEQHLFDAWGQGSRSVRVCSFTNQKPDRLEYRSRVVGMLRAPRPAACEWLSVSWCWLAGANGVEFAGGLSGLQLQYTDDPKRAVSMGFMFPAGPAFPDQIGYLRMLDDYDVLVVDMPCECSRLCSVEPLHAPPPFFSACLHLLARAF